MLQSFSKKSCPKKNDMKSSTISKQGNFIKSITHNTYTSDNLHILCQGYGEQDQAAAKFISGILTDSLLFLLESLVQDNQSDEKLQMNQKTMINLLDSCFDQIKRQKINGTCSIACCMTWKNNNLTILKNPETECYIVTNDRLKPLLSREIPFKMKQMTKKHIGFINPQKKFEENMMGREIFYYDTKIAPQDKFILLGSSWVFNHFSDQELLHIINQNQRFSLSELTSIIVDQAKKRWRTIYQADISLIMAALPNKSQY